MCIDSYEVINLKSKTWAGILAAFGMLILILDSKTVLSGAATGIDICIKTVIPSLFPFFVVSSVLSNSMQGQTISCLRPLGKICGIPKGTEFLLLLGMCGGYPVGAKCVYDTYTCGVIRKKDAQRMLGFCSNAGPSFIFGMTALLFQNPVIPWVLWGIQIISMILTAAILPNKSDSICQKQVLGRINNPINQALKAISSVCGWIVTMRVVINLFNRWILWCLPKYLQIMLTGVMELSNGCIELFQVESIVARFIFTSVFLSLGGICVLFQTQSLTGDLGIQHYVIGKLLQTSIAAAIAFLTALFLFPGSSNMIGCVVSASVCAGLIAIIRKYCKNNTGNYAMYAV